MLRGAAKSVVFMHYSELSHDWTGGIVYNFNSFSVSFEFLLCYLKFLYSMQEAGAGNSAYWAAGAAGAASAAGAEGAAGLGFRKAAGEGDALDRLLESPALSDLRSNPRCSEVVHVYAYVRAYVDVCVFGKVH